MSVTRDQRSKTKRLGAAAIRSWNFQQRIHAQTSNTAVFSNVSVALGRNTARAALDVGNGQIAFGSNLYAAGGNLPLVIVGAVVYADGNINQNYGIGSVTQTSKGIYEIMFPLFTNLPIAQVTVINADSSQLIATVSNLTTGTATVTIFDPSAGDFINSDFSFEVKGPLSNVSLLLL